jgi:hypothetical protein
MQNNLSILDQGYYECDICNEPITNPICDKCLTEQVFAWSTIYPTLNKELMPLIKSKLKQLSKDQFRGIKCIKCNGHKMSICTYCFVQEVLELLEQISVQRDTKREFLQFFNVGS